MQELWDLVRRWRSSWPDAAMWMQDEDVTLRLPSGPGVCSFVVLQSEPTSVFTPRWRLTVETLVAGDIPATDGSVGFLTEANRTAFGGSWQRFVNGNVGVSGSVLVHDASAASLAALLPQLVALQARDALELGRPEGGRPVPSANGEPPATLEPAVREVEVPELVEQLTWRSAPDPDQRFEVVAVDDRGAELLVPAFVGDPVRSRSGDLVDGLTPLTITRTQHPRRGMGTLLQVPLPPSVPGDTATYARSPWAYNLGRWHATSLGSLRSDPGPDGSPQLTYRAFLPDELLSVIEPAPALTHLVDVALGVVSRAGTITEALTALAAQEDPDEVEFRLQRDRRLAPLRASVPLVPRPDGLVDLDGPVVEFGRALLDRLAIDQLQIFTAPFDIDDGGFVWLPTPWSQRVRVTPVRASRHREVSEVRLVTRLGVCEPTDAEVMARRCVRLAPDAPMGAVVVNADHTVDLVSSFVVHEGAWRDQSSMIAMTAVLQTNLAGPLATALHQAGVRPSRHEGFEHLEVDTTDSIADVVPTLLQANHDRLPDPRQLITSATEVLLRRASTRPLDAGPKPGLMVPLTRCSDAGGVDPVLGELAVFLEPVDHPQAGPGVRIMVHPGYHVPLDEVDLLTFAARLTRDAHARPTGAFTPAWEAHQLALVATITLPCLLLDQLGVPDITIDDQSSLLLEMVDAAVAEVAAAAERHPSLFSGFDRSQLHLHNGVGAPTVGHLDGYALWAPHADVRRLAVRLGDAMPQRWSATTLPLREVDAFVAWLDNGPRERFSSDGQLLVAEARGEHGVELRLPHGVQRQVAPEQLATLTAMLRHAEAPALGTSDGPVVLTPLEVRSDHDGLGLLLPAAPALAAVLTDDTDLEGVTAITADAVWLGLRSPSGTVHVELLRGIVDDLLATADAARSIAVTIAFPVPDPRVVATSPPPPTRLELATSDLRDAFERLPG